MSDSIAAVTLNKLASVINCGRNRDSRCVLRFRGPGIKIAVSRIEVRPHFYNVPLAVTFRLDGLLISVKSGRVLGWLVTCVCVCIDIRMYVVAIPSLCLSDKLHWVLFAYICSMVYHSLEVDAVYGGGGGGWCVRIVCLIMFVCLQYIYGIYGAAALVIRRFLIELSELCY